MAFDQEDYFRRNRWGSVHLPPYRDLRQEPAPKPSRWPMFGSFLVCAAAIVLWLVILVAPV